jgi:predicted alpha/beta-fold hydrolase
VQDRQRSADAASLLVSSDLPDGYAAQCDPQPRQRWPWWGADLQTLRDTLRPQRLQLDRSTAITIELGGDAALLARYSCPQGLPVAGLVVVVHGLGGCSEGLGVRRLAHHLDSAGFGVLRLNMRGAGAGRSLATGTYAARCNSDLLPALIRARQLADRLAGPGTSPTRPLPLYGVGLSLGGTMLLNGLLERPGLEGPLPSPSEQPLLDGLVCVSSPLDLFGCAVQFDRPRNRLYRRWVLKRLRQLTLADPRGVSPQERSLLTGPHRVRSLQAFDAAITAPRWGHGSMAAYYAAASPLQRLQAAMAGGAAMPPILLIHAADDPWVPVAAIEQLAVEAQRHSCPWLETLITAHGGHNGFHRRGDAQAASWADRQVADWLSSRALGSDLPHSPQG